MMSVFLNHENEKSFFNSKLIIISNIANPQIIAGMKVQWVSILQ